LNDPSPGLIQPFIDAAKRLEAEGVRAITGSCGFLALYQEELSEAVSVPLFSSSLIQVPLAFYLTGAKAPVGIITASSNALTPAHFEAVGAGQVPVSIVGMEDSEELAAVISRDERTEMDLALVEQELLDAGNRLLQQPPDVRSIVLECTDLPPYAFALQNELKLPVFDLITLTEMAHHACSRTSYTGIMPW
jgi:aspartate/glutamate racemase